MKEQNENDTSFLEYGPVKIVSGSFAGFAGYYDDDDDYKAVV